MSNSTLEDLNASLRKNHHDMHALCDRLEEIADSLPDNIDRQTCVSTARAIQPILEKAHTFEETKLFPALEHFFKDAPHYQPVFARLKNEHHEDMCFGEEVQAVLSAFGKGENIQTADATGYMLRGFFENLRRHMAFEQELARPLQADT